MMRPQTPDLGRPIARPAASSGVGAATQATARIPPVRETKEGAPTGAHLSPASVSTPRVTTRRIDQIIDSLSPRDHAVLTDVDQFRFLSARHIRVLRYHDHSSVESGARAARRTLKRLVALRVIGTLPRRVGGIRAGSAGLVYFVDVAGDRILRRVQPHRSRRRIIDPSPRFVDHTLAIAEVVSSLSESAPDSHSAVVDYQCEPAAWRTYPGLGGGTITLKPDLYLETAPTDDTDLVAAHFVEIDLGGESIPTLLRKCQAYEQYRRSGSEQTQFGSFPRVLWSLEHSDEVRADRRRQQLRAAIDRDRQLPNDLFLIGSPTEITNLILKGGTP